MGSRYEKYRPKVDNARTLKSAVVLPRLMRGKRAETNVTSTKALRGIRSVGWTYIVTVSYECCSASPNSIGRTVHTRAKKSEKGRPRSFAKAHVRRAVEANKPKIEMVAAIMSMQTKTFVPAFEPVAW